MITQNHRLKLKGLEGLKQQTSYFDNLSFSG